MASSLYRTTRPLYLQVTRALDRLGIATIGSPTTAAVDDHLSVDPSRR